MSNELRLTLVPPRAKNKLKKDFTILVTILDTSVGLAVHTASPLTTAAPPALSSGYHRRLQSEADDK